MRWLQRTAGSFGEWSVRYPYAGVFAMLLARCSAVDLGTWMRKRFVACGIGHVVSSTPFDLIVQAKLVEEARRDQCLSNGSGEEVSKAIDRDRTDEPDFPKTKRRRRKEIGAESGGAFRARGAHFSN